MTLFNVIDQIQQKLVALEIFLKMKMMIDWSDHLVICLQNTYTVITNKKDWENLKSILGGKWTKSRFL